MSKSSMNGVNCVMLVADQLQLDRRVLHEAASLVAGGWQVEIISLYPDMTQPQTLPGGVSLRPADELLGASAPVRMVPGGASPLRGLRGLARRFIPRTWQEVAFFGLVKPAERMRQRYCQMKLSDWDLMIAHDLPLLPLASALKVQQGRGKVILDAHELYDEQLDVLKTRLARRYWRTIENSYLPACDGVMTVSPRLADELQKRHGLKQKPPVLYNACPYVAECKPSTLLHQLYGISEQRELVLCQGGVTPGRSLAEFILAWRHLSLPRPALVFLGFGLPDYIKKLQRLIDQLGLEEDVYIGKAVPPDRVLDYTRCASLGLISNRGEGINNTDGAPNRLFEYIQARVPVLSFTHNGVRQILDRTGTGWVIGWKSPRELADLIEKKLEQARQMDRKLLGKAAWEYSWERQEEKFLSFIANLMG